MTNKEMLRRLKECFMVCKTINEHISSNGKSVFFTTDDSDDKIIELIEDLEKDVEIEKNVELNEALKRLSKACVRFNKMSTYGMYGGGAHMECFISRVILDDLNNKKITKISGLPIVRVKFSGPCTILEWGNFKTVVKCAEEDYDNWSFKTGLGVALYRYYKQAKDTKKDFKFLTKYCTLEQLAEYSFERFCGFNKHRMEEILKNIKNVGFRKWIDLEI